MQVLEIAARLSCLANYFLPEGSELFPTGKLICQKDSDSKPRGLRACHSLGGKTEFARYLANLFSAAGKRPPRIHSGWRRALQCSTAATATESSNFKMAVLKHRLSRWNIDSVFCGHDGTQRSRQQAGPPCGLVAYYFTSSPATTESFVHELCWKLCSY